MYIETYCKSYFRHFTLDQNTWQKTPPQNCGDYLKIASYFTVIIPFLIGIVYNIASLSHRDIQIGSELKNSQKICKIFRNNTEDSEIEEESLCLSNITDDDFSLDLLDELATQA